MPLVSGFYDAVNGDRVYDAEQFGSLFDGIISDGIFANNGDRFVVRASTTGMQVYVGSGKAWLNRRWVENTGDETLTIQPAHASLDRIDLIVLKVDTNKAVRDARLEVIKGTPAGAPTAPPTPNTPGVKYLVLAQIRVAKNARVISPEFVSNRVGTGQTPYVAGPAHTIDLAALQNKLQGEFNTWFESVRQALTEAGGNTATEVANLKASDTSQNQKIKTLESKVDYNSGQVSVINGKFANSAVWYEMGDASNGGTKNAIYRGHPLGSNINPYLAAIRAGTFKGMYLGDYWTLNGVNWRIVAFNYFYGIGSPTFNRYHVVVVPDNSLYQQRFNDTNTMAATFTSFEIGRTGLNRAISTAKSLFGDGNVVQPLTRFPTAYNAATQITQSTWLAHSAGLMTEDMLFGRPVFSRHDYQRGDLCIGQFPLFRVAPSFISFGANYWTRDVSSSTTGIYIGADSTPVSQNFTAEVGVRPYVAIG